MFSVGDTVRLIDETESGNKLDWTHVHPDLTSETLGKIVEVIPPTNENPISGYLVDFWITRKTFAHKYLTLVKENSPEKSEDEDAYEEESGTPSRYNQGDLEVWDAIIGMNLDYMQGNVVKYTSRYKHKNGIQDIKKAINYLIKILAEETGQDYYTLRECTIEELKDVE